jgi:hypothetical protein
MVNIVRALALAPALAAALVFSAVPASASGLPYSSAGAINANGTVGYGTGFTAQHSGTGQYVITYPTSTGFTSLPAVVATPFGLNGHDITWSIASLTGASGGVKFVVQFYNEVGKHLEPTDTAFMFVLMES